MNLDIAPQDCRIPKCTGQRHIRGWCQAHYGRWKRHGDPRGGVGTPSSMPLAHRIAIRTDRSGGHNACWPWLGACNDKGYGQICLQQKNQYVTRLVYELNHGPIAEGLYILHTCDNPPCVNPKHLWAGTPADNVRDMFEKGRDNLPTGERHKSAKLSTIQVIEIRRRYSLGVVTYKSLAEKYGVGGTAIRSIVTRKNWKHVA